MGKGSHFYANTLITVSFWIALYSKHELFESQSTRVLNKNDNKFNKLGGFRVSKIATLRQEKSKNKDSTCGVFEEKKIPPVTVTRSFEVSQLKKMLLQIH